MHKNKRGVVGLVSMIIMGTIAVLLLANLFIPQVATTTRASAYSESLIKLNYTQNETKTLNFDDLVTLNIEGLTLATNYTQDLSAGTVTLLDSTHNGTYSASYTYYASTYLTDTAQRSLMVVVIFGGIIGLLFFLFRGFGLI